MLFVPSCNGFKIGEKGDKSMRGTCLVSRFSFRQRHREKSRFDVFADAARERARGGRRGKESPFCESAKKLRSTIISVCPLPFRPRRMIYVQYLKSRLVHRYEEKSHTPSAFVSSIISFLLRPTPPRPRLHRARGGGLCSEAQNLINETGASVRSVFLRSSLPLH